MIKVNSKDDKMGNKCTLLDSKINKKILIFIENIVQKIRLYFRCQKTKCGSLFFSKKNLKKNLATEMSNFKKLLFMFLVSVVSINIV